MGDHNKTLANPAVVGLAGFSLSTFVLQMHNLGYCGLAPVIWLGLVFGGVAQLVAGFFEFKKNNNFGFCAFTGYGAFWISLSLMLLFGKNAELIKAYPLLKFTEIDLGVYLVAWTVFSAVLFIAAMKHNSALALTFLTVVLGLLSLVIKELTGNTTAGILAYYDLLVCAFLALYLMAVRSSRNPVSSFPSASPGSEAYPLGSQGIPIIQFSLERFRKNHDQEQKRLRYSRSLPGSGSFGVI